MALWLLHTGSIGLRWIESYQMGIGHAPLSNLYESLVFFAWAVALALLVARWRFGEDMIVLLGLPVVFLIMASTSLVDHNIKPLIPALQSNWLVAHVMTCFLGYSGFAVSFVAALLLLISRNVPSVGKHLPRQELLDEIVYRSVTRGFSPADGRHYHRSSLGGLRVGFLLVMGPERDVVPHHMGWSIRHSFTRGLPEAGPGNGWPFCRCWALERYCSPILA